MSRVGGRGMDDAQIVVLVVKFLALPSAVVLPDEQCRALQAISRLISGYGAVRSLATFAWLSPPAARNNTPPPIFLL